MCWKKSLLRHGCPTRAAGATLRHDPVHRERKRRSATFRPPLPGKELAPRAVSLQREFGQTLRHERTATHTVHGSASLRQRDRNAAWDRDAAGARADHGHCAGARLAGGCRARHRRSRAGRPRRLPAFPPHLRRARRCPCCACPATTTSLQAMHRELRGKPFVTEGHVDIGAWRIVLLDSSVPNSARGRLSKQTLAALDSALSSADSKHTLVCLHHHPVADVEPLARPGGPRERRRVLRRDRSPQERARHPLGPRAPGL